MATACASSTPTTSPPPGGDDPIAALSALINDLRSRGATDADVRPLDQRLRLAEANQKSGDRRRGQELAREGLVMGEQVNAGLDEKISAAVDKMDVEIRHAIRDIAGDLTDKLEDRAIDRYEAVKKKIVERNERATPTKGRIPINTYTTELAPIDARIAAIRESMEAKNVKWNEEYRSKFRESMMRVRGTEPMAYQEAVRAHRENDVRTAKQAYLAVLTDDPNNYKALFNLGELDLEIGNYPEAAIRLERAFQLGLTIDDLDGWIHDFLPNPEPLIAALHETNQTAKITEVRAQYDRRKAQVEARAATRKSEEAAAKAAPAAPAQPEAAAPQAQTTDACMSRPYAGKVQFVKVGLDSNGVEEIICAPQNKRMKGDAEYWYYPSGTVIFINGKVDRTSTDQVVP
jgi:tetratricopeptide (TPR) repeat protein